MINNSIFVPYMNLYFKISQKNYWQFTKINLQFWEKVAICGFKYKER